MKLKQKQLEAMQLDLLAHVRDYISIVATDPKQGGCITMAGEQGDYTIGIVALMLPMDFEPMLMDLLDQLNVTVSEHEAFGVPTVSTYKDKDLTEH